MNSRNNKMELLGNAPISKALLAMGIPTMLGMMVNAIYNLVGLQSQLLFPRSFLP